MSNWSHKLYQDASTIDISVSAYVSQSLALALCTICLLAKSAEHNHRISDVVHAGWSEERACTAGGFGP